MGIHNPRIAAITQHGPPGIPVSVGGCAGWLHPGSANRAVLMVGAQGFEGLCAYQTWRAFASLIAARGPSVLRIDLPGEGDSLESPPGTNPVDEALRTIRQAAAWLQKQTGADEIAVAGLRLGGLLAVNALEGSSVSRLVLLAPPASGKAYVRELTAQARVLAAIKPGTGVFDDGVNLCGYKTLHATLERIRKLDFGFPKALRTDQAFLSCVNKEQDAALVAKLGPTGERARLVPFDGYDEMMVGPTSSKTPWALLDDAAIWLSANCAPAPPFEVKPSPRLDAEGFRETRLRFGQDFELAGVLCEPAAGPTCGRPVILPNAGANNHVGWGRMHVDFARRLARKGIASLRYDGWGIGDSACQRAGPRPLLYSDRHKLDLTAAVDCLVARGLAGPVVAGVCAGAFTAFHGVHRDSRISHVVLVNMLRMIWHPHNDLDIEEKLVWQSTGDYAVKALEGRQWKRVLAGEVSLMRAAKIAGVLAARLARKLAGPLTAALGYDQGNGDESRLIRRILRESLERGATIDLVYAENDSGREELARHLGREDRLQRRYRGLSLTILRGSDHELSPESAREAVYDLIVKAAQRAA